MFLPFDWMISAKIDSYNFLSVIMLTKPFKPLALAFLVNLIISVEDKIKYKKKV